jgi:glycosyltransferase involved in cell wall biosynthesis
MPMRNAESYVREAVRSVLAQDVPRLELIVVDDGSVDRSREIVECFVDPRVRIVPGPRRGFAPAWNAALAAATGDIVMQCDADDSYTSERVALQLKLLEERPECGAVCGGFATIDSQGRLVARLTHGDDKGEEITAELLEGKTRTTLCSFAIRREHLAALNGMRVYFETGADIDLQFRLAERCRIWYVPTEFYRYRLHETSVTHRIGRVRRTFFDEYAQALRRQRASGRRDDLDLGNPLAPPKPGKASSSREQIQGMLLGTAWQAHRRGDRIEALKKGFRALTVQPGSLGVWKSVAALLLKPGGSAPKEDSVRG